MPLYRAIALSALFWGANVDAFVPTGSGIRERVSESISRRRTSPIPSRPRSKLNMSTRNPPELNFYKVLGVSRTADEGEIKRSYRRLAKLYHPDANPERDTTEQFQALNRAYEVLSDPGLKKNYDMFGNRGVGTSAASDVEVGDRVKTRNGRDQPDTTGYYGHNEFFGNVGRNRKRYNSGPVDFDTFSGQWGGPNVDEEFSTRWKTVDTGPRKNARRTPHVNEESAGFDFFSGNKKNGSGYRPYGPIIGDDIALDFELDLKTAVMGGPVEVTLNRFEKCETCTGTGARPGTKKTDCATCGGSGVSIPISRSGPVFSIACPDCRGTGEKIHDPCTNCHGAAVHQKVSTVKVDIPAGVMAGNKLRIEGEGDVGLHAGPSGDLFLFLKVKDDPIFRREGSDIFSEVSISCVDAIVGATTKVPAVDGEAEIEIPPGTQPGHVICVKKGGAPSLTAGQRGDHFVTVEVEIPHGEKDMENQLVQLLKQKSKSTSASPPYFTKDASSKQTSTKQASKDVRSPHNFSAPFPKTNTKVDESKSERSNASVSFPTVPAQSAASSTSVTNNTSTIIDEKTLADLKAQAAKADAAEKERLKFEKLAAQREQEINDQAEKLKELTDKAEKENKQRAHFEKLATEREVELKESARRQTEMNKDITIRIRQSHGQTTRITVKKSIELSRVFEMVGRQRGILPGNMMFTYDGKELTPNDTPLDLEMEANSLIDVAMRRRGGGVGTGVRYR